MARSCYSRLGLTVGIVSSALSALACSASQERESPVGSGGHSSRVQPDKDPVKPPPIPQ